MRTFSGSHRTPHKKTNTFLRHAMASSAQHQTHTGMVNTTMGSPLRDVIEEKDVEIEMDWTRTEGPPVLWGEFQGTQQTEGEDGNEWYHKGLHRCRPDDTWVAFRDAEGESQTDDQEGQSIQHDGRWWCEDSTTLCTREHSIDKSNLEHIFESCFPPASHALVEEEIQPLESLLHDIEPEGHKQTWRRSADYLQRATSEHTRDPDLLYKWEGSQLHCTYLSCLHINPNDKGPPHRTKFSASSPVPKQRPQPHKLSTGLARDPELKLMKMASVSVHVTGFSPSHHLQSFFQHWSQPSGKTRLKVAYEFNRSLLV
ncbi:uncharacterized protein LOC130290771 [Hyla sarda]|uniref:uncharacterized protein LOC130290771 n=1 Tax=Hyla sarda TaxID=327740 RepID=UPI0024C419F1|nr:uncharacterized protein LOC130290771 [Hyla sarda]